MNIDDLRQLFRYNEWASKTFFDACGKLSAADLMADRRSSHPSILDTLRHVVFAEWLWLRRWRGLKRVPWPGADGDLDAVRREWSDVVRGQHEFLDSIDEDDLPKPISYTNDAGEQWTYLLGSMMQHTVNHSTYHRGQLASMLRQSGVKPPATDLLVYFDCGGS
jgi:uncharacterized damage-inducible protein DinB